MVDAGVILRLFGPLASSARGYSLDKLHRDVLAGLTVSVVTLPQAMAFAMIAGVPPEYGIYTAIFQGSFAAIFSSSEHPSTGPTNTHSLLIAATLSRITDDPHLYLELAIVLTLMKGLIQLAFAVGRMGALVRYVSRSVIVGYTAGAGVLIAAEQVRYFLSVETQRTVEDLPGVLGNIQRVLPNIVELHWTSISVGLISLAIILVTPMISRLLPGSLLGVTAGALLVWYFGWTEQDLMLVGRLPQGLPAFELPAAAAVPHIEALLSGALAIALLGMIESAAIGKTHAIRTGKPLNANQEFFSQAFAAIASSLFQCFPGSVSFSRSALAHDAGGKTRFAEMFNALFVAVIFLLLAPLARYIPLTSLAAVLFVIGYNLIDWRYLMRVMQTNRAEGVICLVTLVSALVLPLQYAIYVGIFLNIMLYLRRASQLHIAEMVPTPGGPYIERPLEDRAGERSVMFLQIEGDLFFAVADELQDRLTRLAQDPVKVLILRLKRTHSLDTTVMGVLERFAREMHARGGHVILCGLKPSIMNDIRSFGLADVIGEANLFETSYGIFTSAKRAIQRARQLIGSSIDDTGLDINETEGWAYEI